MSGEPARRSGGRPTATAAILLETSILETATAAFLADGYAETTIEGIARKSGVAKRTIYARWNGKPALFFAVLKRLMAKWLFTAGDWAQAETIDTALDQAAEQILAVALTPEAMALHRLLIAESGRFPELPRMMHQAGSDEGTVRIAALLHRAVANGELPQHDMEFAAEQFMHLVLGGPQRRALGLGRPLDAQQVAAWRTASVVLFLSGIRSSRLPG